jgi:hypothetical protein
MFWILCDPSSGSTELCLIEITCSDPDILLCAWSVFGSVILKLRCVRTVLLTLELYLLNACTVCHNFLNLVFCLMFPQVKDSEITVLFQ